MRLPLTLRVMFHALRSAWVAGVMAVVAWVALASASPQERIALNAQQGTERPVGLVPMRVARAIVYIAPDRSAQLLSLASGGELSVEDASAILDEIANGGANGLMALAQVAPRMADGAKFVQVDQP